MSAHGCHLLSCRSCRPNDLNESFILPQRCWSGDRLHMTRFGVSMLILHSPQKFLAVTINCPQDLRDPRVSSGIFLYLHKSTLIQLPPIAQPYISVRNLISRVLVKDGTDAYVRVMPSNSRYRRPAAAGAWCRRSLVSRG